MQKLTKNIFLVLTFIIFSLPVNSAEKNMIDVYNILKEQLQNLNTISFNFSNADNKEINGSITAKKGNKYKLVFSGRIIICDSKTVWNHSLIDKNVIISNYDKNMKNTSIEGVFFDMIALYQPAKLSTQNNSKGEKVFLLTMKPKKQTSEQFDEIILTLDGKYSIEAVSLNKNFRKDKWLIEYLKINSEIDDNTFKFKESKDIETIDLR